MSNCGRGSRYTSEEGNTAQGVDLMAKWILGNDEVLEELGIDYTQWQDQSY